MHKSWPLSDDVHSFFAAANAKLEDLERLLAARTERGDVDSQTAHNVSSWRGLIDTHRYQIIGATVDRLRQRHNSLHAGNARLREATGANCSINDICNAVATIDEAVRSPLQLFVECYLEQPSQLQSQSTARPTSNRIAHLRKARSSPRKLQGSRYARDVDGGNDDAEAPTSPAPESLDHRSVSGTDPRSVSSLSSATSGGDNRGSQGPLSSGGSVVLNRKERELGHDVERRMQERQKAHAAWRAKRYARETVLFDAFVAITAVPVHGTHSHGPTHAAGREADRLRALRDHFHGDTTAFPEDTVHSPFVPREMRQHGHGTRFQLESLMLPPPSGGNASDSSHTPSTSPRTPLLADVASLPAPHSNGSTRLGSNGEMLETEEASFFDNDGDDEATEMDYDYDDESSFNSSGLTHHRRAAGGSNSARSARLRGLPPKIDVDIRLMLNRQRQRVRMYCKTLPSARDVPPEILINHVIDPRSLLSPAQPGRADVLEFVAQDHACGRAGARTKFRIYFQSEHVADTFHSVYDGARSYNAQFLRVKRNPLPLVDALSDAALASMISDSTTQDGDETLSQSHYSPGYSDEEEVGEEDEEEGEEEEEEEQEQEEGEDQYDDEEDCDGSDSVDNDSIGQHYGDNSGSQRVNGPGPPTQERMQEVSPFHIRSDMAGQHCSPGTPVSSRTNLNASTGNGEAPSRRRRSSRNDSGRHDVHALSQTQIVPFPPGPLEMMQVHMQSSAMVQQPMQRGTGHVIDAEGKAPHISKREGIKRPSLHISPRQAARGTYAAVEAAALAHRVTLLAAKLRLYVVVGDYSGSGAGSPEGDARQHSATIDSEQDDDENMNELIQAAFAGPWGSGFRHIARVMPDAWKLATRRGQLLVRLRHAMKAILEASGGVDHANRHAAEVLLYTGQLSLDMQSYVNSSILLQRAAAQFQQLLRDPSPPAQDRGRAVASDTSDGNNVASNCVVNAEVRLGDAKAALLLAQMRFHMQDFDASNVLHQRALAGVRQCHSQWSREIESVQQRLQALLLSQRANAESQQPDPEVGAQTAATLRCVRRLAHKQNAVCRVALVAVLSSLAVTCEAVERFDTSVQLLQRCSDEVQQLEKYVTKLGTTDAVLWGQPPAHHHPLSSLIESQPLDERTADFFLPTLWVSWVASPFPNLESVSAVESRAQQVAAEQNRLRGRRTGNRHSTYSCQEPDHPLGGVMAFSQELAVARVRILTRMATSYKRLRNRAATRACCLQVHQLYVDRLRVDLAQHVAAQDNLLQLATCTAAGGSYVEARDLFRQFVEALLQSVEGTKDGVGSRASDAAVDDHAHRQSIFLLSSPPERRKQYVFALRALVTIYRELGDETSATSAHSALAGVE